MVTDIQIQRTGIGIVSMMQGSKLRSLIGFGKLPPVLVKEGMILFGIQQGDPVVAFNGEYLKIAPVKITGGLETSMNFSWSD
jgi:hypothetical protein